MAGKQHDQPDPRKTFGDDVKRRRELAGLSQAELGEKAVISSSHVGKIELGRTRCSKTFAQALDKALGADGELIECWGDLVEGSRGFAPGFDWHEVEADEDTDSLVAYEPTAVYGLLQTERYAYAQLRGDKIKAEARIGRQAILARDDPPPPRITALLAEVALTNEVGDPAIMREQLEHLLALGSPRLTVQVVPSPVCPEGTDGSFVIATMADRRELAHVGTPAGGFTLGEVSHLTTLAHKLTAIREHSLPLGQSRDRIRQIMEERWT
jgi:transcriptional regulator with XRE-family HTH domain